jgi:hypothetical protein
VTSRVRGAWNAPELNRLQLFTVLNIANWRYLLGRDSAFAGTHYNDPRQVMGQATYRFHY